VDKSDAKYGPTWLSIRSREPNKKMKRKSHSTIQTEELFQKKGQMTYRVPIDGEVEVCIRASTANSKKPLLFGLNIEPKSEVPRLLSDDQINMHWTHMEDEIRHLLGAMKIIQKEADFSKNRESVFHAQTIAMHAASMWWPIVHVCVLIVTGFTQATHIVRFFKSRRLV
jgi:emp24/gp25L/p24 family/GOLD